MMRNVKGYINIIIGFFVFVAFLLINTVIVSFQQKPFLDVLLYSGLMFVCWILIRNAFAEQGLINGQKDKEVVLTKREHLASSNAISPYRKNFDSWCKKKNKDRLKEKRINILSKTYLTYEDYFDDKGFAKDKEVEAPKKTGNKKTDNYNKKRFKKACRCLEKARNAFVALYEPEEIVEQEKIDTQKKLFGPTTKKWKNVKIIVSIVTSIALCVMLAFVDTEEKILTQAETFILVFQLLIMAGSAFSFYFSAVNFICTDWRRGVIKKVKIMDEFFRTQIGEISYENDKKLEDGSVVLGKKVFTENRSKIENMKKEEGEEECLEEIHQA